MVWALLLALAFCQTVYATEESDALLDSFLAADGIVLSPAELQFRRKIFEATWIVEEGQLSLEGMYTANELKKQNGAVNEPVVTVNEELQKRAETDLASVSTPSRLDGRKSVLPGTTEPLLNPAQNQQTCGNCYIHTWVAALEIAYAKATGSKVCEDDYLTYNHKVIIIILRHLSLFSGTGNVIFTRPLFF